MTNPTTPTVSIVLTSYNHAPYLRQAIDSVIHQTYTDWELLIWDDLSTDSSWDIIQSYTDPRIRTFQNKQQRRYIYAINESITQQAKGKYIAIHHSDDAWEKNKLSQQVQYLDQHNNSGAVFSHVQLIDEHNKKIDNDWFNHEYKNKYEWLRCLFLNTNHLCHPSALVRKKAYIESQLYKLVHAQIDDAEMWTRLLLHYDIHVLPEKLTLHRIFSNGDNVSSDNSKTRARLQFEWFQQKKVFTDLSTEQLLLIFPEAKQWLSTHGDSHSKFILSMIAIHLSHCVGTRLFGLDLLYKNLIDSIQAQYILEKHQFSYLDFIVLSGEQTLFLNHKKETNIMRLKTAVKKKYNEYFSFK